MVDVVTEIVINSPLDKVTQYAANPDNENIKSAAWVTSEPLRAGSQNAFKAQFLGRQLAYTYQVVEYSFGQKLVMRTAQCPFPMETTYTWEMVGNNQTRMTLRNVGHPAGFSKLFASLMATMMRKANIKDLERIEQIIETTY